MMQRILENCRAEIFYAKCGNLVEENFEVRVMGDALGVYTSGESNNLVGFKGTVESQVGHYRLTGVFGGSATLHIAPGSSLLEGSWEENGYEGMWRIYLPKCPKSETGHVV